MKYKILMDALLDLETAEANFCQCFIGKSSLKFNQPSGFKDDASKVAGDIKRNMIFLEAKE